MIANKHISKIIIAITAVAVALCILAAVFYDDLSAVLGGVGVNMEYETKLFDTDEIISVDIQMDEDEWNKMLKNATSEEYYAATLLSTDSRSTTSPSVPRATPACRLSLWIPIPTATA